MGWGSFLCWSWNVKEKGRFGSHSFSSVLWVQGGFWKGQFSLLHHMTLPLRRPPGIQTNQNKTATELELSAHGDWQREREPFRATVICAVAYRISTKWEWKVPSCHHARPHYLERSKSRRLRRCLLFLGDSIVMAPRQINTWLGKSLSAIIKGSIWEIARVLLVEVKILQNWHLVFFSPTRLDLTPLLMS